MNSQEFADKCRYYADHLNKRTLWEDVIYHGFLKRDQSLLAAEGKYDSVAEEGWEYYYAIAALHYGALQEIIDGAPPLGKTMEDLINESNTDA